MRNRCPVLKIPYLVLFWIFIVLSTLCYSEGCVVTNDTEQCKLVYILNVKTYPKYSTQGTDQAKLLRNRKKNAINKTRQIEVYIVFKA